MSPMLTEGTVGSKACGKGAAGPNARAEFAVSGIALQLAEIFLDGPHLFQVKE